MENQEIQIPSLAWPPLTPGILVKRYKRFLADVKLQDNRVVTAHCPNSGSMKGCSEPGRAVFLSLHDNPKRKLKFTWELIQMPGSLVGINTLIPNRLAYLAAKSGFIAEFGGYENVTREVNVGHRSRLDLMLTAPQRRQCFVEVKNCTLVSERVARFPDAVTARGLKHLMTLQKLLTEGRRCIMFYLIQRMDADVFEPARQIDPEYGRELRKAAKNGVEIVVYDVSIDLKRIALNKPVPWRV